MPMTAPPVPDWLMAASPLRLPTVATPTPDANVHQGTQVSSAYGALHPETWGQMAPEAFYGHGPSREGGVEAVPFGSLLDPVSQAAFLAAPGVQALARQVLPRAGMSAPRLPTSFLAQQRGNLGRPPMNATGELLPESMVRDEAGNLQRLYHGTDKVYPDFAMNKADPGGLYGPGVYMTESPRVAGGTGVIPRYGSVADLGYAAPQGDSLIEIPMQRFANRADAEAFSHAQNQREAVYLTSVSEDQGHWVVSRYEQGPTAPNVRPVYADLKRPFDMDAPFDVAQMNTVLEQLPKAQRAQIVEGTRQSMNQSGRKLSNSTFYEGLVQAFGDRAKANETLQQMGYDGITHIGGAITGGQPHKVYIAFSPENVYPSFNVDALRPP